MAKLLSYAVCMRSHGIADFPDPTVGPGGKGGGFRIQAGPGSDLDPKSPRFEAATRVCNTLLPFGGTPPPPTAQQLAEDSTFAACMRRHGFGSFPDPSGRGVFVLRNIDVSSSQFQSTQRTCRSSAHLSGPMRVQAINSGPQAPASG